MVIAERQAAYAVRPRLRLRSIEIFSGSGGLALGTHLAGFHHEVLVEHDADACATLRRNAAEEAVRGIRGWTIQQRDIRGFDYSPYQGVDLVAGGPPCQPFSIGGNHRGVDDSRNMIPEFARAVRELQPRVFLMENVRGLLRPGFTRYFEYVLKELSRPDIPRREGEAWDDHFSRLREAGGGPLYNVSYQVLNAADHGVPQTRQRVFVVGFRADLGIHFAYPEPSHGLDRLLFDQWVSGEYWDRHGLERPSQPPPRFQNRIMQLGLGGVSSAPRPWRTVRDVIADLPEPAQTGSPAFHDHRLQPGARPYPGHTGSPLDLPAKTLKAGDHGVPGGENMLRRDNGDVRYFTVREAARIQTYPDHWRLEGAWTEAMRQIGNAVPVDLAWAVAKAAADQLHD